MLVHVDCIMVTHIGILLYSCAVMHLHLWGICFIINGSKIHTGSHVVMVLHKANNSAVVLC